MLALAFGCRDIIPAAGECHPAFLYCLLQAVVSVYRRRGE
jgi:hypothetical protein